MDRNIKLKQITRWLTNYNIHNYIFNDDLTIDVKGKIIYIVVGTIIIAISVFLACLVSARLDSQREYEENLEKRVRDLEEKQ